MMMMMIRASNICGSPFWYLEFSGVCVGGQVGGGGDCEKVLILLREFPCFLMNFHLWTDPLSSRTPFWWHHKCCHLHSTKIYFNSSTLHTKGYLMTGSEEIHKCE